MNSLTKILDGYASRLLHQRDEETPPLDVGLDIADKLGAVDLGSAPSWQPGAHACGITLRDELAAPHYLKFYGYGDTREKAVKNAIDETMLYVEARHRG